MTRDDIAGYWKRRYGVGSTVLALTGSVDHAAVVELAGKVFGEWSGEDVDHEFIAPSMKPVANVVTRETEQAHIVLGGEGLDRADERRWAFEVMNHVLGGGMSSRLFTSIREERGLVYTVYSFRAAYADTGAWGVYAGTTPESVGTVLDLIHAELELMVRDGITEDELDRARGAMRGGLALAMEDANSRMVRLGRDELVGAPHLSVGERLAKVEAVTLDDIRLVAESLLSAPKVIGAVGPFESADLDPYLR